MNLAPSYLSAFIAILAVIFPDVNAGDIGVTVNTLVIIAGSILVMARQVLNKRSTLTGGRPEEYSA